MNEETKMLKKDIEKIKKAIGNCLSSAKEDSLSVISKQDEKIKERNSSYEVSYSAIRNWCDKQIKWTAESSLILANIVFGWMPTVILFHEGSEGATPERQEKDNGLIIENMAAQIAEMINKNDFIADQSEVSIDILKRFLKNSYVGASKFLHFIYPHDYAMWDSNIAEIVIGENAKTGDKKNFIAYQKAMRSFVLEHNKYSLRDVELRLFKAGQQSKRKNAK